MEFEEINPNVWKPEAEEDSVDGVFIAQRENVGPNDSTTYYLEKDNKQMMIWGSTIIDSRMEFAKIGDHIRITYKGIKKNSKNQDTKIFKVERAKVDEGIPA